MNILVLAGDVPATSEMPGSPRLVSLCRELAERHRLILMSRGESEERWRWFLESAETKAAFAEVTRLPEPPPPTWRGRQHHRLRLGCHLMTKYRTPAYDRDIRRLIGETIRAKAVDLVYVDSLTMTQYLDGGEGATLVADMHDCSTLLYRRTARHERHLRRKLALFLEAQSIARWERSLARRFAVMITNSEVDTAALRQMAPEGRIVTIPNGVDCDYFAASSNGRHAPNRIVFTGVMNYGPNADAAKYFAEEIFPLVRAAVPAAEFWIVGADPEADVRALGERDGVHVTGRVPDVRPFIAGAAVCVCPIRYGAGIKNKILAAMAMGRPVVSTGVGLEGIEAVPGQHALRGDAPPEFAARVGEVLTSESLAQRLSSAGYQLVIDKYSWRARADAVERELAMARRAVPLAGVAGERG